MHDVCLKKGEDGEMGIDGKSTNIGKGCSRAYKENLRL